MTTAEIPIQTCPYCGRNLGATTGLDPDAIPKCGDISICFYCGEVSRFDDTLHLIKITPVEMMQLINDNPKINKLHKKIIAMARIK